MAKSKKKAKKAKNRPKKSPVLNFLPKEYRLAYAIIFGLAVLCYANTLFNGWAMDDSVTYKDNKFVDEGMRGIRDILSHDTFIGKFGKEANILTGSRYRPLSVVTFAIEKQFGFSTGMSHLVNLILYGLTGMLIYLILCRLLIKYPAERWYLSIPFIATVLYMLHPLHTEAIANIKGRDEIMTFGGSLLALWYTVKYLDTKEDKYLGYTFIAYFLALMSKENAITFLAVIPLSVYVFTKHDLKENIKAFVPLLAGALLFLMIRQAVVGGPKGEMFESLINEPFLGASFMEKYATIFSTFGIYLKLLFFPHPLTYDYYPYHIPITTWADPRAIIPLIIYVGLGVYALIKLPAKSVLSYGILFYLITFSIVSNFFISIGVFMSERFLYIPSLGFTLIIAYLLTQYLPKIFKNEKVYAVALSGLLLVVGGAFAAKSIVRNFDWKDDMTLNLKDVQTSSNSAKSNFALGGLLMKEASELNKKEEQKKIELYEQAIPYLIKATEVYPGYDAAHSKLADAYYYKNEPKKSIMANVERLRHKPDDAKTALNIVALLQQQDWAFKDQAFAEMQKLATNNFNAFFYHGKFLFDAGRNPEKARALIQKAQQINELNKTRKDYPTNKQNLQPYINR